MGPCQVAGRVDRGCDWQVPTDRLDETRPCRLTGSATVPNSSDSAVFRCGHLRNSEQGEIHSDTPRARLQSQWPRDAIACNLNARPRMVLDKVTQAAALIDVLPRRLEPAA